MKEIRIGNIITDKRKEKQLTQDELAQYMGVSKAAISKWETGQSYPDITLLPILAAYFNMSIDDLMGYEPQMVEEDIKKLYERLCHDFTTKPFESVIVECESLIKKYYSCFPLLQHIGLLFINHSMLAPTPEETLRINGEAKQLFERIRTKTEDLELAKQSLQLEVYCCLSLNQPEEALEKIGVQSTPQVSNDVLKAMAHQMLGQIDEAKAALQIGVFQQLMGIIGSYSMLLTLSLPDVERFEDLIHKLDVLDETFEIHKLNPSVHIPILLTIAGGYIQLGKPEKALDYLEEYSKLGSLNLFPLKINETEFFNLIGKWMKDYHVGVAPRSEVIIKQSLIDGVIKNPMFVSLHEDERYIDLVNRLKFNL